MSVVSRVFAALFSGAPVAGAPGAPSPGVTVARNCAWAGATVLVLLGGPVVLTVLCLLAGGACWWWGRPPAAYAPGSAQSAGPDDRPAAQLPEPAQHRDVEQLSDRALCQAWRTSYLRLQRLQDVPDPAGVAGVTRERSRYLDELQRRDPSGFDAWLVSGAGADPGRYLGAVPRQRRSTRE